MRISEDKMQQIVSDLGINIQFIKGRDIAVKNCWHFYTDGHSIDSLYYDTDDFRCGMNRIFVTVRNFDVIILAFTLMDTHVHFVLYGDFQCCNRFIHEYIRRTSIYMTQKYSERKKLQDLPISHQTIDTDRYLKAVICYVIKNATAGGLPWMYYDHPWSSGPLYFRSGNIWTSPRWVCGEDISEPLCNNQLSKRAWKSMMKTRSHDGAEVKLIGDIIFPGEYVAYEVVERLFRTQKSFLFFLGSTKESDIESQGGCISWLSLPDQEMRKHKNDLCRELFGTGDSHQLDTGRRILLARKLRAMFNSSPKQIARICGLNYSEIKDLL